MFFLITFSAVIVAIQSKSLPPGLERCSISDPDLSKCLEKRIEDGLKFFADGNRELGLNPIEPFFVPRLDLGNSSGGSVSLHQIYENVKIHGMASTTFSEMEVSLKDDNCYWNIRGFTPVLRMESDYTLKGQILLFPINEKGSCNNTLYDLDVKHRMKCERYTKKDKKYFRVVDYTFDMQPKRVIYDFNNVLGQNEQLAREIQKTVNENALEVYADVKGGFEDSFSIIYKEVLNSFFSRVPEEELFLP